MVARRGMAVSDYAVLPDGTMYIPPPLYPPAGEPPEEWPPPGWGDEDDQEPVTREVEDEGEDSVEVAVDQGPDVASAEPAAPFDGDGMTRSSRRRRSARRRRATSTRMRCARRCPEVHRERKRTPRSGTRRASRVAELLTAGLVDAPSEGVVSATSYSVAGRSRAGSGA